jgi:hypothetical protein
LLQFTASAGIGYRELSSLYGWEVGSLEKTKFGTSILRPLSVAVVAAASGKDFPYVTRDHSTTVWNELVGFSGHVGGLGLGGLGLGGLGLCGLDLGGLGGLGLGGLDLCGLGLDPSPPSVHIALCLLCFLVSFLLHVNQHLLFPTELVNRIQPH